MNSSETFDATAEHTNLKYYYTDTIQKKNGDGDWENTYIISVENVELDEKNGLANVSVDVAPTPCGETIINTESDSKAAEKLNSQGYKFKNSEFTAEDVTELRQDLKSLNFEVLEGELDNYSARQQLLGQESFEISMDYPKSSKGVVGAFKIGANSVNFVLTQTLSDAGNVVRGVDFDEAKGFLASASGDDNVYVYDTADFTLIETLTDSEGSVRGASFDETNNYLAIGSFDDNVYVYDTTDFTLIETLTDSEGTVQGISFDEGNNYLAFGGFDDNVYVYDTTDFTLIETLTDTGGAVRSANFDETNNYLAIGSSDENVYVYDTTDITLIETLTDSESIVRSVSFDETNNYLASGGDDDDVYVYDTTDFTLIETLTDSEDDVKSVSFDETNNYLAFGGFDNNVYVYNLESVYFISGTVFNDSEEDGVSVWLINQETEQLVEKQLTDANGEFKFEFLRPDEQYHVAADYEEEGELFNAESKPFVEPVEEE